MIFMLDIREGSGIVPESSFSFLYSHRLSAGLVVSRVAKNISKYYIKINKL